MSSNVEQYERALTVADHFANDPTTLFSAKVDSLPLVADDVRFKRYVPIIAGSLSVDYTPGHNYRSEFASAAFGFAKEDDIEAITAMQAEWEQSDRVKGLTYYVSNVHSSGVQPTERLALMDRDKHSRVRLDSDEVRLLIDWAFRQNMPGVVRTARMYRKVNSQPSRSSEEVRTASESRADVNAIKGLAVFAGVGAIYLSHVIPVQYEEGSDEIKLVCIDQDLEFAAANELRSYRTSRHAPVSMTRRELSIVAQDMPEHILEGTADGRRVITGEEDSLVTVLSALERAQAKPLVDHPNPRFRLNTPSTQGHAKNFLHVLVSMQSERQMRVGS